MNLMERKVLGDKWVSEQGKTSECAFHTADAETALTLKGARGGLSRANEEGP